MTKKIYMVRTHDGRVIGDIESIKCDGSSILKAYENKKPGDIYLFNDQLEQVGKFTDSGMSFDRREIGELVRDEINSMRVDDQDAAPLIKGEGMIVLMNGYLELNGESPENPFSIGVGELDYPVVLEAEPDLKMIDDYVTFVGTMRVLDGKTKVVGFAREYDGSKHDPTLFGAGTIDVENKRFIADMEDDFENSVDIALDEDTLKYIAEQYNEYKNCYIAGVIEYDGENYSFTPTSVLQANMTKVKKHVPEMGMMS